MDLKIEFKDLEDLYTEARIVEKEGNQVYWNLHDCVPKPIFTGLRRDDIIKYKYGYTPGVSKLEDLSYRFLVGASRFKYKWNEDDGDDMDMRRAFDGLPYLKKRVRTVGNNSGKFITIHVNIAENALVNASRMMHKTYAAVAIINRLEALGYRTRVVIHIVIKAPGTIKDEEIKKVDIICPIKQFDENINISLMLYCVSPWFFRYWIFLLICAKYQPAKGLGTAAKIGKRSTRTDIYIDSSECLYPGDVKSKFEKIEALFEM